MSLRKLPQAKRWHPWKAHCLQQFYTCVTDWTSARNLMRPEREWNATPTPFSPPELCHHSAKLARNFLSSPSSAPPTLHSHREQLCPAECKKGLFSHSHRSVTLSDVLFGECHTYRETNGWGFIAVHRDWSKVIERFQNLFVECVPRDRKKLLCDGGLWAHADLLIIKPNAGEKSVSATEQSCTDSFSMQDGLIPPWLGPDSERFWASLTHWKWWLHSTRQIQYLIQSQVPIIKSLEQGLSLFLYTVYWAHYQSSDPMVMRII